MARGASVSTRNESEKGKAVRVTVDLEPAVYEGLREWAYQSRMSHSDVLRSLIQLLLDDRKVSQQVSKSVNS